MIVLCNSYCPVDLRHNEPGVCFSEIYAKNSSSTPLHPAKNNNASSSCPLLQIQITRQRRQTRVVYERYDLLQRYPPHHKDGSPEIALAERC
jgi:hypothetical protein